MANLSRGQELNLNITISPGGLVPGFYRPTMGINLNQSGHQRNPARQDLAEWPPVAAPLSGWRFRKITLNASRASPTYSCLVIASEKLSVFRVWNVLPIPTLEPGEMPANRFGISLNWKRGAGRDWFTIVKLSDDRPR